MRGRRHTALFFAFIVWLLGRWVRSWKKSGAGGLVGADGMVMELKGYIECVGDQMAVGRWIDIISESYFFFLKEWCDFSLYYLLCGKNKDEFSPYCQWNLEIESEVIVKQ